MDLKKQIKSQLKQAFRTMGLARKPVDDSNIALLKSEKLKRLAKKINSGKFAGDISGIPGWLSSDEAQTLYTLAKDLPGPFLEIGAWCGRSACCIAMGIRDSREKKQFITTELNPSVANFRKSGSEILFFHPADAMEPRGVCTEETFERDVKPIVSSPEGVIGHLEKNLSRLKLQDLVLVKEGNFLTAAPRQKYSFIFCDAMHDPVEIKQNTSGIIELSKSGTILACHDITMDPSNEKTIRELIPIKDAFIVDSMFVAEIA